MSLQIDVLAFITISNKKVLVASSRGRNTWYIPGGKRNVGETDIEALTREIREELSVELLASTLRPFGVFEGAAHDATPGARVRMTCYTANTSEKLRLPVKLMN